jgi:histidyl-tRNA synthetase
LAKNIQAIRGMNDILPIQTPYWQYMEDVLRQIVTCYGYEEIRVPTLEHTHLFKRTIGEVTDIIEKEMYTFEDRNGESLSLRPEGTAGVVRAGIQHGLLYNQIQKFWYLGPMFRYERPQLGRFRQFHQFGVEAFGMQSPEIDAEQLLMTYRMWENLNLQDQINLQINSLGTSCTREIYREKLVEYFSDHVEELDEDSKRRLHTNPLRILDSKNSDMQLLLATAPRIIDFLDEDSKYHLSTIRKYLDKAKIPYEINPRIVRGLDYYGMTVYEWVTERLGAQGTVCAGGRYDGLVAHLGGKATPATGFAIGLERLVALLESVFSPDSAPHCYVIMLGEGASEKGIFLTENLRKKFPELRILNDYSGGSFKNQFRKADKSGAKVAIIIGEAEVASDQVSLKYLRKDLPQIMVKEEDLKSNLLSMLVE